MSGTGFYTKALNGIVQRDWKAVKSAAADNPFKAGATVGAAAYGGYNMFSDEGTILGGAIKGGVVGGAALMGWKNRHGISGVATSLINDFSKKSTYSSIGENAKNVWGSRNILRDRPV